MKQIKSTLVIFAVAIFLYGCTKSDTKPAPVIKNAAIPGYWFGTANGGAFNQSFLLRADGTLKVYDFYANAKSRDTTNAYYGTGTYTVSGDLIIIDTSFPNGQTFRGSAIIAPNAAPETFAMGISPGYNGDVYTKQ